MSRPEMGGFFFGQMLLAAISPLTGNCRRPLRTLAPLKIEALETICFPEDLLKNTGGGRFFWIFPAGLPLPALAGAKKLRAVSTCRVKVT